MLGSALTVLELFKQIPPEFAVKPEDPPWEVLANLPAAFTRLAETSSPSIIPKGVYVLADGPIWIDRDADVMPGAALVPPIYVGPGSRLLPGSLVRGSWIGHECLVGHSVEIARSVCLDRALVPHQSIILDSAIGEDVNVAGGARFANLPLKWVGGRSAGRSIHVVIDPKSGLVGDTGMERLGLMCGDHVLTPMTLATNPGTIIGRDSIVMPRGGAPLSGTWLPGSTIPFPETSK